MVSLIAWYERCEVRVGASVLARTGGRDLFRLHRGIIHIIRVEGKVSGQGCGVHAVLLLGINH